MLTRAYFLLAIMTATILPSSAAQSRSIETWLDGGSALAISDLVESLGSDARTSDQAATIVVTRSDRNVSVDATALEKSGGKQRNLLMTSKVNSLTRFQRFVTRDSETVKLPLSQAVALNDVVKRIAEAPDRVNIADLANGFVNIGHLKDGSISFGIYAPPANAPLQLGCGYEEVYNVDTDGKITTDVTCPG